MYGDRAVRVDSLECAATRKGGSTIFVAQAVQHIGRAAAESLFPSRCLACDARPVEQLFRGGVCEECWRSVPHAEGVRCDLCAEPLAAAGAARCGRCLIHPPAFRALRAAAPYRGSARAILLAFKFRGADYLGRHLAKVSVERLAGVVPPFITGPDEVVSVPATRTALGPRGYHAADVLAEAVARRLRVPFAARRLRKIRETARQSGLSLERRRANVRGAFRAIGTAPEEVLLVDDVVTSGWTARECAAALIAAGSRRVDVWCFARASRDDVDGDAPVADR
jgi:ComF family protein